MSYKDKLLDEAIALLDEVIVTYHTSEELCGRIIDLELRVFDADIHEEYCNYENI